MGLWVLAVFAVGFGGFWATAHLVLSPVAQVDRLSATKDAGVGKRYFVRGRESGGAQWREKLAIFSNSRQQQREVVLQEGDFNLFLKEAMAAQPQGDVKVSPNVDISDGQLGLALVYKYPSVGRSIILQTRGNLVYTKDGYRYRVQRAYWGGCPMPKLMAQIIADVALSKSFNNKDTNPLMFAWNKAAEVKIQNNLLMLRWL